MNKEDYRSIRVIGSATVSKAPDTANVYIYVEKSAPTQSAALTAQVKLMKSVMLALSQIDESNIKTQYYHTSASYKWDGKKQKQTGYTTQQRLEVTMHVDMAPDILAALASIEVQTQVNFSLKNSAAEKMNVLHLAVVDAQAKAKALATSCAGSVGQVLFCDSSDSNSVRSRYGYGGAKMACAAPMGGEAPAPYLPEGEIELQADVTMVFELV